MPAEGFFRAGHTRPGPNVHGPRTGPPPSGRRPGGGSSRRPRWDTDAGITDRDVAALRWLGQQYAARSDVLRVLLGRLSPGSPRIEGQLGETTLRDVLARWEDRGLIDRDRLLGHLWVAPTAKALRLVGLDVRAWSFVIPQLAHVQAVGVVRLALEPSIPEGGRWLSERELRREAGKSHVPDAAIQLPDDPEVIAGSGLYGEDVDPLPKRIAVEVELTRKGAARLREAWTRPRHGRWTRTVYYAPPEVAGYLAGQLQRIRPRHPIQVHPLPEVAGTTYMRPRRCLVTRSNHSAPGHGWQATPGQPIPRAARQPAANGLLLVILVLVWISPLSIVAWLVGQAVILLQRRWHWWRFTLASLAAIALVLAVTGPQEALRRHIFVPQHFWQYVALHFGFGPPGTHITISQFLWDLVATQIWLAAPVGLLAASLSVWNAERAAGGAEWSPFVRRRRRIDQRTRDRRTARLLARPRDHKLTTPALGVALDGDLGSWRQGRYVVPPEHLRGKAMAVVGAPGAGKTVTLLRLAYLAGLLGRKVCFADCKGTDPTLVPALIAAYRLGNPTARIGCWPQTAMDMWRGSPVQVASRLLAVEQFTEPFYQRVASAGLRLALTAPDMPPVEGSDELLRRLDVDELAALWEGRPLQLKDIEAIGDHLPGARLRYADFFAALAGAFDRGSWSFEDVDLAVLTVPTLLSKAEADAAMRVVLEDYGHYATGRKPREGEDALLVLDEFSALASGVDSAINLAERVRDVGVQVVVAAQSVEGLGDHRQAPRLLAACAGGIVVHQCPDPERLLALAGEVRVLEHNWELDHYGPRGFAKARMGDRPRIDPEAVRQAQPGEAWVIQAGQSIHLRVLPPPAVALQPAELTATIPLADDTIPLPIQEPVPVGIAAAVALAGRVARRAGRRVGRRRELPGRLPSPAWRPWLPMPPLPGRGRR